MPETGPGSVGGLGRRLLALIVDLVLATLVTLAFVRPSAWQPSLVQELNSWSLLTWFVITVAGIALFAATPGMMIFGLRVGRVGADDALLWPLRLVIRTALIIVVIPAVIWDRDRRGLHDKLAGTIVVSAR